MPSPNPNLKHERNLRGWSQGYLGEQIGVADYYISRWESGKYAPSPYYQQKMCEVFGKTAEELGFLTSMPRSDEQSGSVQATETEQSGENEEKEHPAPLVERPLPEKRREKAIFPVPKFIVLLIFLLIIVTGGGIIGLVMAQHQDQHNSYHNIYVGSLAVGLGLGVETSGQQREWYKINDGSLTLTYPADQQWGTMFITVGPTVPPGMRPSIDLSAYHSLVVDLRATANGQCVRIGIKDRNQLDDGNETSIRQCLTTQWSTFTFPLPKFSHVDLSHVYVVFEVNFAGPSSVTADVRNVRYSST